MSLTPEQRSARARMGAHALHSRVDSSAHVARTARAGFEAKFLRQVDPDGVLPLEERQRRADHAMRLYMQQLAWKRKKRKAS